MVDGTHVEVFLVIPEERVPVVDCVLHRLPSFLTSSQPAILQIAESTLSFEDDGIHIIDFQGKKVPMSSFQLIDFGGVLVIHFSLFIGDIFFFEASKIPSQVGLKASGDKGTRSITAGKEVIAP